MRRVFLAIAIAGMFAACNNESREPEAKEEARDTAKTEPVIVPENEIAVNQSDSTIHFSLKTGADSAMGKGHLDKNGDPVICYIDLEKGQKISGKVVPGKAGANIRFSHIYMPDGSSDGPFGQTIEYTARQKGTYRLFISPNRMAGDPESTDFTVTVKVK